MVCHLLVWSGTCWCGLSPVGVFCHLLMWSVTCWCGLSPAGVVCHLLMWSVTCWGVLSLAGVVCHLMMWSVTCWCGLSPVDVVCHLLVWSVTCWRHLSPVGVACHLLASSVTWSVAHLTGPLAAFREMLEAQDNWTNHRRHGNKCRSGQLDVNGSASHAPLQGYLEKLGRRALARISLLPRNGNRWAGERVLGRWGAGRERGVWDGTAGTHQSAATPNNIVYGRPTT